MVDEFFESAANDAGDLAGVFEYDGETAYFYVYDVSREDQRRIVDSIHIFSGATDLEESDVAVRWDASNERVGLFLRDVQWAVFNTKTAQKFGGDYHIGRAPNIPRGETFRVH